MSWSRTPVAQALVAMITAATEGAVYVHETPPETLNPLCVVIQRPVSVTYATAALSIDDVELPVGIVGSIEQDDAIDTLKATCRQCVLADPQLRGTVQRAWPTEERNWRNIIGAGGIQLLVVDLVIQVTM